MQKTLKRLEEKIVGKVLNQILYSMNCSDPVMQHRTATALARLAREADLKKVFVDRKGLDILLTILTDTSRDALCHKEAAGVSRTSSCHLQITEVIDPPKGRLLQSECTSCMADSFAVLTVHPLLCCTCLEPFSFMIYI